MLNLDSESQQIYMAGFLRQSWRSFASVADNSSWVGTGLKFKCTQCGKCCTGGRDRVVWVNVDEGSHVLPLSAKHPCSSQRGCIQVSEQEAGAIAGSLGLEGDEFADRYLQVCLCLHLKMTCRRAALAAKAVLLRHFEVPYPTNR